MAAAAILHSQSAAQSMVGSAAPMDSSTSGTSGSSSTSSTSDSATISANDFLTLLVTEMQNQDPTADTDPNEYINQLVEVNSLEQLIDINQTLSTDLGSSTTGSTEGATTEASTSTQAQSTTASHGVTAATKTAAAHSGAVAQAPGNLAIPSANSAAQRVAHALNGRSRAHPAVAPPAIP